MKKTKTLIIIILMLLFFVKCSKKVIQEKKCIVTLIDGKAFLVAKDYSILDKLSIGKKLDENDIIKTDKDTTIELQFGDNSIIRVKENSILKINKLFYENENQTTNIFLDVGKILVNPEEQTEGSSFEVETNSVTVGVRGTEFTVISDQKGSKIAVNSGEVIVKNKINVDSIDKIEKIAPEIAEKINLSINTEIHLSAEEKFEVKNEELKSIETEISEKVKEIAEELEKIKESKKEIEKVIERIEDINIKEISDNVQKVVKKQPISKKELIDQFDIDEFRDIKKSKETLEKKELKKSKKLKENKKALKRYEPLFKNAEQLFRQRKQTSAIEMAKKTLVRAKKEFGDNSRITAIAMGQLAIFYIWSNKEDKDQLNEAENLIKKAINIYENIEDKNDSTLCHFYYQYAEILFRKKDYNEAKTFFNKSFKLSEKRLKAGVVEENQFYVAKAIALKGLANLYTKQKDFLKADNLFKEAIDIFEKKEGKYSTELKHTLEDYKRFFIIQNKKNEAERVEDKILLIMENNSEFKDELIKRKKEKIMNEAWENYEKIFQKIHQLNKEGRKKEAINLAENTVSRAKNELGNRSRITAHAMQNLGVIYTWETDQLNEAENLIKGAIGIYENVNDKNDPTLCHLYHQYASIFYKKKQYEQAKIFFNKSINLTENRIKAGVETEFNFYRAKATALNGLANLYSELKNFKKAEENFNQAITVIEKSEGKNAPELRYILEGYKRLFQMQNKKNESENIEKRIRLLENKNTS